MNPYICPGTELHDKLEPFSGTHHVWIDCTHADRQ